MSTDDIRLINYKVDLTVSDESTQAPEIPFSPLIINRSK